MGGLASRSGWPRCFRRQQHRLRGTEADRDFCLRASASQGRPVCLPDRSGAAFRESDRWNFRARVRRHGANRARAVYASVMNRMDAGPAIHTAESPRSAPEGGRPPNAPHPASPRLSALSRKVPHSVRAHSALERTRTQVRLREATDTRQPETGSLTVGTHLFLLSCASPHPRPSRRPRSSPSCRRSSLPSTGTQSLRPGRAPVPQRPTGSSPRRHRPETILQTLPADCLHPEIADPDPDRISPPTAIVCRLPPSNPTEWPVRLPASLGHKGSAAQHGPRPP